MAGSHKSVAASARDAMSVSDRRTYGLEVAHPARVNLNPRNVCAIFSPMAHGTIETIWRYSGLETGRPERWPGRRAFGQAWRHTGAAQAGEMVARWPGEPGE